MLLDELMLGKPNLKNIGREVTLGGGQIATLLRVKCDDPWSMYVTATLIGPFGTGPNPSPDPQAIAIVEWGAGGVQARAEVDFIHGSTVSVAASFLQISGQNLDNNEDNNIIVSAFVGYMPRGSSPPPQRTAQRELIPAGATGTTADIPQFAHSVVILSSGEQFSIRFFSQSGIAIGEAAGSGFDTVPIRIPNGARRFAVTNNGVKNVNVNSIFLLSL